MKFVVHDLNIYRIVRKVGIVSAASNPEFIHSMEMVDYQLALYRDKQV
jgi:hypothetical protein